VLDATAAAAIGWLRCAVMGASAWAPAGGVRFVALGSAAVRSTTMDRQERRRLGQLLAAATAAAGPHPTAPSGVSLAELVRAAPQHELTAAAVVHRVEGCVHESLHDVAGVDQAVLEPLAAARQVAVIRHLQTMRAVAELDRLLGALDVPWLVVKGPALVPLYRDPGLRSSSDLDVLVASRHFGRVVRAMQDAGYEHLVVNWPLVQRFRAGELTMRSGDATIDLHWHVLYSFFERRGLDIDIGAFLERRVAATVGGRQLPTLDPVDTVLHLGIHAAKSGADRLVWLKDLDLAVRDGRVDLDELVDRASAMRCGPLVGLALDRTARALGTTLADGLVTRLLGRGGLAIERLATLGWRAAEAGVDGSAARHVARAQRATPGATLVQLARMAHQRVVAGPNIGTDADRLDPARPDSLLHRVGGDADRDEFLRWVERQ
jgi:hypothetical protein